MIHEKENTIQEIEIDSNIMQLYKKYHGDDYEKGVRLSSLVLESKIYEKDTFEVSSLQNNDITSTLAKKIYDSVSDELEKIAKYDENNEKYYAENEAEEIIKKGFNNLFLDTLTFNHETMNGCHVLSYHEGKYYYTPQCGDVSDIKAYSKITKAEKDKNNIYIYEVVNIITPVYENTDPEVEIHIYKWTYNLKNDGNYYFIKAEKVE